MPARGLRLDWAAVPGATRYEIARDANDADGANNFVTVQQINDGNATSQSFTNLSLVEAMRHTYRVRACVGADCSKEAAMAVKDDAAARNLAAAASVITDNAGTGMATYFGQVMSTASGLAAGVSMQWLAVGAPNSATVSIYARPTGGGVWSPVQTVSIVGGFADRFAASVSLSPNGQWLVVGAPDDRGGGAGINPDPLANARGGSGAVYVYWRDTSGAGATTWVPLVKVKAFNPGVGDAFGTAVSITNNGLMAVGAPLEDSGAQGSFLPDDASVQGDAPAGADAGAVYLYTMTPSAASWEPLSYVKPVVPPGATSAADARFGSSVSMVAADGAFGFLAATLAVGAPGASMPLSHAGAVQVFVPGVAPGLLVLQANLSPQQASAAEPDRRIGFGASLSLSADGSLLAVGHPDAGAHLQGAAHVYARAEEKWQLQRLFESPTGEALARFGTSVSLYTQGAQSKLVIGAWGDGAAHDGLERFEALTPWGGTSDVRDSGAAFYCEGLNGTWSGKARLKAPRALRDEHRGRAVAITRDGSELLLGADNADTVIGY